MPTRKLFLLVVLPLLLPALLQAVGQAEPKAEAKGPVTISFWFPTEAQKHDDYFKGAAEEFSRQNPGIKVEVTVIPADAGEIMQKLNTAQLSKTYPDVFSAFLVFIGTRGARGEFYDVKSLFDSWADRDDLLSSATEMGKFKGSLIGFGYFPAPVLRVHRKDFFAEAGLDPSRGPETWEEWREMAQKATVRDAGGNLVRAGTDLASADPSLILFEPTARQNGSLVVDEINQAPSFTDDGAVEALQFLAGLWNENVSFPHDWAKLDQHPFLFNRSAIGYLMPTVIMNLIKNDPSIEDRLGYASVMRRKERSAFCGYRLFTIGAGSKHVNESWEFIKYLLSPDQFWKRYELLAIPPVRKSLMPRFIAAAPERNRIIAEHVEYGKGKPVTPWTSLYNKHMHVAYQSALNKVKPARQALLDAEKALLEELKTFQP